MALLINWIILCFVTLPVMALPPVHPHIKPFWDGNKKVYSKIKEDRDIIVLVKSVDPKVGPHKRLQIEGIGVVNLGAERAYHIAKDLETLKDLTSYIKEIKFNKKSNSLYMHSEAFKYHARMEMEVRFVESSENKEIRFKVVKGVFSGMLASISFKDLERRKSQITLKAIYNYTKLPLPEFFLEFGLEVVIQKIAARMRSHLESNKGS